MINVYVAGASKNWRRARDFIDRVKAHPSMRITQDWTVDVERATKPDHELTAEERAAFARTDLGGVAGADVLVVLLDTSVASVGRWVELGYALRMSEFLPLRILVSGGGRLSIFSAPGLVDYEGPYGTGSHDDDVWHVLAHYAKAAS